MRPFVHKTPLRKFLAVSLATYAALIIVACAGPGGGGSSDEDSGNGSYVPSSVSSVTPEFINGGLGENADGQGGVQYRIIVAGASGFNADFVYLAYSVNGSTYDTAVGGSDRRNVLTDPVNIASGTNKLDIKLYDGVDQQLILVQSYSGNVFVSPTESEGEAIIIEALNDHGYFGEDVGGYDFQRNVPFSLSPRCSVDIDQLDFVGYLTLLGVLIEYVSHDEDVGSKISYQSVLGTCLFPAIFFYHLPETEIRGRIDKFIESLHDLIPPPPT